MVDSLYEWAGLPGGYIRPAGCQLPMVGITMPFNGILLSFSYVAVV